MAIQTMVKTIKEIHKDSIIFIKVGSFYHVYGRDAYIISYLFKYKLKDGNEVSIGFPISSLEKIKKSLEKNQIDYLLLDRRNNYDIDEKFENNELNKYNEYYQKAKKYINLKNRIDNIYSNLLDNIEKEDFRKIVNQVEDVLYD